MPTSYPDKDGRERAERKRRREECMNRIDDEWRHDKHIRKFDTACVFVLGIACYLGASYFLEASEETVMVLRLASIGVMALPLAILRCPFN